MYIVCIFIRFIFIYGAYSAIQHNKYYNLFAGFYYILGFGSLYHWITNAREKGGFNQPIWWNYLRPVHGTLYIIAAYFIYQKNLLFIPILLLDTLVSIDGHVRYHYMS